MTSQVLGAKHLFFEFKHRAILYFSLGILALLIKH
jgi:hypothetical protein